MLLYVTIGSKLYHQFAPLPNTSSISDGLYYLSGEAMLFRPIRTAFAYFHIPSATTPCRLDAFYVRILH